MGTVPIRSALLFAGGAFALLALSIAPPPLQADTLLLKNGDRLSGRIRIDPGQIVCIDSPHSNYEVRLELVQRGTFEPPRNLRLHLKDRTLILQPRSLGPAGLAFDPDHIIGDPPPRLPNPIPWKDFLALTEL